MLGSGSGWTCLAYGGPGSRPDVGPLIASGADAHQRPAGQMAGADVVIGAVRFRVEVAAL
jgi:hypothetical protein